VKALDEKLPEYMKVLEDLEALPSD